MSVSNRLLRLLKSVALDKMDLFDEVLGKGETLFDEKLREWERKHGLDTEEDPRGGSNGSFHQQQYKESSHRQKAEPRPFSDQLYEDLNLFGLKPPTTIEQVKKARNSEMKKFHPDKFQQDPEKQETAKQIIQIYNAAFERIKKELVEGERR